MPSVGPLHDRRTLLVVAAPAEARAVLHAHHLPAEQPPRWWRPVAIRPGLDLALAGVGKAPAAACTVAALLQGAYDAVLSIGVAGSLPRLPEPVPIAAAVLAEHSVFADEGVLTPAGFIDVARMGFPPAPDCPAADGVRFPADPDLLQRLRPLADLSAPVATVSVCSGTDELALAVAQRTGAAAEAMEGAAVAVAAARLAVPFAELRVISNTTGDRDRQRWDLAPALARLARLAAAL